LSLEIKETIKEDQPKVFEIVGLIPPGTYHVTLRDFKSKAEAESVMAQLKENIRRAIIDNAPFVGP
ncbi:MAG: hypothetical protein PVI90_18655, partial [Desulfobacteraceae bacterium]